MTATALDFSLFQTILVDPVANPWLERAAEIAAVWAVGLVPLVLVSLWLSGTTSARVTGIVAAMAASLALTIAGVISWTFYVPRPFTEGLSSNVLRHVADSSFPSDHLAVFGAATLAAALGRHYGAAVILALGALAVGWARIALGLHFPSDILGGFAIGGLSAIFFRARSLKHFADFVRQLAEAFAGRLRYHDLFGRSRTSSTKEH